MYHLAIDIGASSGRHILGYLESGKLILEEIYRFDNLQVHKNGHDCWNVEHLWGEILQGLQMCKKCGKIPATVGIDTWGVDYVLLDKNDQLIGDAVAYRDGRTEGMNEKVEKTIPFSELYALTGIQYQTFNTIYQLMALQQECPQQLQNADRLLHTPDYYHFLLTGKKVNEYTIASTGALVNAETKQWEMSLISRLQLPKKLFGELEMPGTMIGHLRDEVQQVVGFDAAVVLPASHDTASAFLAIPALDDHAVYLSSGTWSLLGVENDHPITTTESLEKNFSNEGGAWGRYRYLKNIMGLWMIQSIRRELNGVAYIQGKQKRAVSEKKWSFPNLIAEAKKAEYFTSAIDVNRDCFLAPDSMIQAIKDECTQTNQPVPETVGELMQCVYTSLSLCYRDAILDLEKITGKTYTSINIVGGGCQDSYLNERTAKATGLPVYAGPVEGTAIGNLIIQMISSGELKDLQTARDMIRVSFEIKEVNP